MRTVGVGQSRPPKEGGHVTATVETPCTIVTHEKAVVVELRGEVDLNDRARLARQLMRDLDGDERRIVVDASNVSFMDASILRLLTVVAHLAEHRGGTLVLVADHRGLQRILHVTGFDRRVAVADSLDEALGANLPGSR
jgi:anti-anti-sigma factor